MEVASARDICLEVGSEERGDAMATCGQGVRRAAEEDPEVKRPYRHRQTVTAADASGSDAFDKGDSIGKVMLDPKRSESSSAASRRTEIRNVTDNGSVKDWKPSVPKATVPKTVTGTWVDPPH